MHTVKNKVQPNERLNIEAHSTNATIQLYFSISKFEHEYYRTYHPFNKTHQFNVFDVEEQKQASVLWMFKADNSLEKLEESMLFSGLLLCCLLVLWWTSYQPMCTPWMCAWTLSHVFVTQRSRSLLAIKQNAGLKPFKMSTRNNVWIFIDPNIKKSVPAY